MTTEFIVGFLQGGRRKPKKFKHWVRIPDALFAEMVDCGALNPEDYCAEERAFFQFDGDTATVNFQYLYESEDFYAKITNYLLIELMGENPVERGGVFF